MRRRSVRGHRRASVGGLCAGAAPTGGGSAPAAGGTSPFQGTVGDEMKGKSIELSLAVIAGWPPSQVAPRNVRQVRGVAKEKYGYKVTVRKTEAPFAHLFQKVAPTCLQVPGI